MNFAKTHLPSAIKQSLNKISTLKPTINLSLLDIHLQKCGNLKQFNQIFSQMIVSGLFKDTFAASRLINFTSDSHFIHLNYSFCILNQIESPNGFTWNRLMKAYLNRNYPQSTIFLYKLMQEKSFEPDNYTYPILIQACSVRLFVKEGRQIHNHVLKMGFDLDVHVLNTLITMYGVCGDMIEARKLFDESPVKDSVSWNSILAGYVQIGNVEEAIFIFDQMPERNIIASNSMIVLLGKTGHLNDALKLFDKMPDRDMVSWSAMISSYEQNEMFEEALVMFEKMASEGIVVDEVVIVSVLSACSNLSDINIGKLIHGLTIRIGIESYVNLQNALIHMYSNCEDIDSSRKLFQSSFILDQISWNSMISGYLKAGLLEDARILFDSMPNKDVVSWSTMISGYTQHDQFLKTLELFHKMQLEEIKPDEATVVGVISACAHLAALDQGKWVHAFIRKNGLKINSIVGTTLIDMYMKCGCVENAMEVFHGMEEKGVSSWNALIVGLAMNGSVDRSLETFSDMKRVGVVPNEITFMGILGACQHVGLVEEGRRYFDSMIEVHNIKPNSKHYGCMVDLLGRAGFLEEAEELAQNMPVESDIATWGALLGACKKHGNTKMGERIGKKLVEKHSNHDGFHVLLSNIYASKGKWEDVLEIRGIMKKQRVVKVPGCSWIEADGFVHEFLAGDRTHPRINEIEKMLDEMSKRLKKDGYAPDTNEVSLDIDEEEKETSLYRHSEKLAIAFGIISISPSIPIRITKNLRICVDCHNAAKAISRSYGREIIVRDRNRFHHFKEGSCSCSDYW